jgi:hypothetical protein
VLAGSLLLHTLLHLAVCKVLLLLLQLLLSLLLIWCVWLGIPRPVFT